MSRLYLELQTAFASETVTPAGLRRVLQTLIETQAGLSSAARLVLRYEQMLLRPALASANVGWKRYPVEIDATLIDGPLKVALRFSVEYSSTCPASAPRSRHTNAEHFPQAFADDRPSSIQIPVWCSPARGPAAT